MPRFSPFASSFPLLFSAALLSGCANNSLYTSSSEDMQAISAQNSGVQNIQQKHFLGLTIPYRIDIQQGNFVSREMVAQVKEKMKSPEGMTPEQVRFVMGTPLLNDMFHKDRWDYPFRLQKSNGDILASNVTILFKDDKVASVIGGDLPTENDYLTLIAGSVPMQTIDSPADAPKDPLKKN
jgi:outer membrane protein assembly factor BamE